MAGDIHGITNLSNLSVAEGVTASAVSVAAGGVLRMTSGGTFVIRDAAQSWRTVGAESSIASIAVTNADNGVWALLHQASGLSLCYRSAGTIYFWSSTASKVAG